MIELWTGAVWTAGGYGGWAYVRLGAVEPQGVAGGDRRTTITAMALTAALAGLEAVADTPAQPLRLHSPSRDLVAFAADSSAQPAEDQDLWKRLRLAVAARPGPVSFSESAPPTDRVVAFAQGWAEFARDIAKTKGAFSSPIPKRNLQALIAERR
jgi:hypothetical protein